MSEPRKPRSQAQRDAARLNGAKSKGPITPEGKARVRFNALKHGFTAQFVILPHESSEMYLALLESLFDEYQPETTSEALAIEEYCMYTWRLRRSSAYIALMLAGKPIINCPNATLAGLQREDRTLQRLAKSALRKFLDIRSFHRANPPVNPPNTAGPSIYDLLLAVRERLNADKAAREAAKQMSENKPEPTAPANSFLDEHPAKLAPPLVKKAA